MSEKKVLFVAKIAYHLHFRLLTHPSPQILIKKTTKNDIEFPVTNLL